VCSSDLEPAWDPDFNTADLPVLLPMKHLNPAYARHFMPGR
jgi:putative hemolysin